MKPVSIVSCTVILSIIAMILFCGELPSNPIQDPNNADVRFFTESKNPSVAPGGSLKIGMEVTLPQHVSFIKVTSSCQNIDTLMEPESDSVRDTVFLYPEFAESGSCTLFVVATPYKASKKYDTLVVHVFEEESAIWNKEEETLAAIEGEKIKHDLEPYLTESDGVTLSTNRGTISGTVWEWTPRYGSDTSETATITAKKDGETMSITLKLTVSPGDTTAPVLTLVDDTLDGTTVGSSRIIVACTAIDEEAGVDKVFFTFGTDTVEASLQEDDRYSGEISGLARGVPTEITITAIDKSMKRNRSTLTFSVTVDSMVSDTSPDTGNAPVITKNLDESLKVNEGSTLELTIVATGTPEPTYQWYKDDELIKDETDAELRIATVTESDTGVYHVVVSNGVGEDMVSVKTAVTVACTVSITDNPLALTVDEGGSATFIVKASGGEPLDYQWYEDGKKITGATSAAYMIDTVTADHDGKKFSCKVNNDFSEATSKTVELTVNVKSIYKVIFDGQGATTEPSPTSGNVMEGNSIGTLPSDPEKTGYFFDGWWTGKKGTGAQVTSGTIPTEKITVYAKWNIKDIDGNIYTDVTIGTQVWMAENLKVTRYNDGTLCGTPDYHRYNYPDGDSTNIEKYGLLYNQSILFNDSQSIAPPGWHIPSEAEWLTLQSYLISNDYNYDGTSSGNKIGKALASTTDWYWDNGTVTGDVGNNPASNNKTGFNAKPAGDYYNFTRTYFEGFGRFALWWSSTSVENKIVKITFVLKYNLASFDRGNLFPHQDCSIRLVRDY